MPDPADPASDPGSSPLAAVAREVAPLAPRECRRPSQWDRLRVAAIARRIDEGENDLDAAWSVLSDPRLGIPRWRGLPASSRPSDVTLARKLAALLKRAAPAVLQHARDVTAAQVSALAHGAVETLAEVTSGDFDDPARARVRLDGARTVFEAVGLTGRAAQTNQSTTVNVLSLGDGLRALRRRPTDPVEAPGDGEG